MKMINRCVSDSSVVVMQPLSPSTSVLRSEGFNRCVTISLRLNKGLDDVL